ncbi:TetR/AcrR family transcriptional regulator [Nonomuraea turkmeniaca]|uniref:TetR/AcrR family transcriptional regulator n=1 Tax=Nonomuraea turkmeniaca TaxID=103838 RepID=A0A5S4FWB0_9ACTN|nr:TetR/AcrR family transcriptional regulator [Nonomuraea turkmeniaca]TMR24938.1 TetR/AcrR family transcriptional regulator [Nonomuraea turkmeniaca]
MPPVKRPRSSPAREVEILETVLRLVAHDGYDAVTMDAVAAAAHASKATLYRRWPSKADMIVDAVRRHIGTVAVPVPTGTLRGDLIQVLSQVAEQLTSDDLALQLIAPAHHDPELMKALEIKVREPARIVMRILLERAVAQGELTSLSEPDLPHDVAMPMLLDALLWGRPVDADLVAHIVDRVLLPLLEAWSTVG